MFLIFRILPRSIGKYIRYLFFKLIGKKIKIENLEPDSKDESIDMGETLKQDFYNALVGLPAILIMLIIIAYLYYS